MERLSQIFFAASMVTLALSVLFVMSFALRLLAGQEHTDPKACAKADGFLIKDYRGVTHCVPAAELLPIRPKH